MNERDIIVYFMSGRVLILQGSMHMSLQKKKVIKMLYMQGHLEVASILQVDKVQILIKFKLSRLCI